MPGKQYIGIDLGTSYSLISIYSDNEATLVKNALGSVMTPSVISIDDNGEILIGEIAKERLITHPDKTISQFKRFMGSDKKIILDNKIFRPEELSSLVLKSLKRDAEEFLGEKISDVIISVPAYFNDTQRKATKIAGELAGLNVERIINEPTAAAIAYGLPMADEEMTFVVLDLGGGTFDVSVLELFENTIEVHASAGDTFLGGNDFTEVLLDFILTILGLPKEELNNKEHQYLWRCAEEIKKELSQKEYTSYEVLFRGSSIKLEITSQEFATYAKPLLERMRRPIEKALSDSGFKTSDLDAIVLVGGATRMPMIKDLASKMFDLAPYTNIDPDQVIAMGASIQAALKSRDKQLKEIVMTDVCPYTLGVDIVRQIDENKFRAGHFLPIIERNTTIPVSRVDTLQTVQDNQKVIELKIYQGESRLVENNILLEKLSINVPKDKAGKQLIDVRFTYDVNGILEVEAFSHGTGETKRIIIEDNPGTLSKKEIEESLKKIEHLKIHPREDIKNRALMALGERLYQESLGSTRDSIAEALMSFEEAINTQNIKIVEQLRTKLLQFFNEIQNNRGLN